MKSPDVNRKMLGLLAEVVGTAVGLALCAMAVYWLVFNPGNEIVPPATGIIAGTLVYYFGFQREDRKNKIRIYEQAS